MRSQATRQPSTNENPDQGVVEHPSPVAVVRRGCALADEVAILESLHTITGIAPFRHMITPGNFRMSVAMTNCGAWGWVTDRTGYRYDALDPQSGRPWPAM